MRGRVPDSKIDKISFCYKVTVISGRLLCTFMEPSASQDVCSLDLYLDWEIPVSGAAWAVLGIAGTVIGGFL